MGVVTSVHRFEVWLVGLDPSKGSEIQKTRPCLIISPNEMNKWLRTVIIAPMTTVERPYPSRVTLWFNGKTGQAALDQIRAVDKKRLIRKLGEIEPKFAVQISSILVEMFEN